MIRAALLNFKYVKVYENYYKIYEVDRTTGSVGVVFLARRYFIVVVTTLLA
ncbi:uncharacterized protein PHALS_08647 [Plasmopara halstedii]|uniref:Uncharacterized protein n=1 Tax=Plasmopara halstedii TaxID=4781 RepID=A0A0P1ACY4_PLAHL|nr:uncharacterized protein PHALS_08647 [Plasmopara halstedii]CEG38583.1 hypothetical protein PHALS_08647 [Plasmopara halstedii]|eukprot:XP_024574952.1 hypothetical protein PHALS_08647 [Plasmopara halstedii]